MNCTALTKNGTPCKAAAQRGKPFCFLHDSTIAEAVAAARRKGGQARRDQLAGKSMPCLTTADEVRGYLNKVMGDTERMLISPGAARAIATLARVQLQAISDAETRENMERFRLEDEAKRKGLP